MWGRAISRLKDIGWILGLIASLVAGGAVLWFIDRETLIALNVNVFRYEILAALALLLGYRFRTAIGDLLGLDADLRNWRSVLFAPFALAGDPGVSDRRMLVVPAIACAYLVLAWCTIAYGVRTIDFVSDRYLDSLRQGMLAEAVQADKSGNYNAAVVKYRAVVAEFPDDIRNRTISARIASIGIQTEYGGKRLAAFDPTNSETRSVAYLDVMITVCSINVNALPCVQSLRQHRVRVEGALAKLAGERRACEAAAKDLDPTLLIDERDREWLEIRSDDVRALCAFSGARDSAGLQRYLERRWRIAEVRSWLKANAV